MTETIGLVDTSVFIAQEVGRPLGPARLDVVQVSAITIGELRLGVLAAETDAQRAVRLHTLERAQRFGPLPVDDAVSAAWARLQRALRVAGRRMPANDSWIAATALAHDLPVLTQDADYDDVPGLRTIRV